MQLNYRNTKTGARPFFPKLMISLPSLLFWGAVAVFDRSMQTASALTAALIHELGHVALMRICGIKLTSLTILPYGLEMTTDRPPASFYEDIAVSSAGCLINMITFPIFYRLGATLNGDLGYFFTLTAFASLTLGILNAFPISSLDGGSMLEALLSLFLPSNTAYRTVRIISFVFLFILWVLATYVFMFSGYNYSLFAMAIWLFARVFLKASS